MYSFNFEIYFTGRDDPRDGCIVIGEDEKPVFFEFETAMLSSRAARTTISSDRHPVAALDWDAHGDGLGVATVGDREFPMENLVLPGSSPTARRFQAADGRFYEWRRCYRDPKSYELFAGPNTPPIAVYRHFPQATPIGPSHGTLKYNFTDGLFLLEVLLSLNLNRWLDWNLD
ncbi:hypothetical protein EV363DRAFT_1405295 [Boletus edulis]|uniref:DUF6593 domain-containing protein n=1 Tax=Boletus edulis BED1 TaxID=1328754 RepID=A0AAD4C2Y4_BOLED|nr:hypothetical protein EV363DRAFT_1405295 [Boletus edulis]KAF8447480.1 hypothetical protein L210DRAFT_3390215 [Boletus edulis BED1]